MNKKHRVDTYSLHPKLYAIYFGFTRYITFAMYIDIVSYI
jgi:hypothetical protein